MIVVLTRGQSQCFNLLAYEVLSGAGQKTILSPRLVSVLDHPVIFLPLLFRLDDWQCAALRRLSTEQLSPGDCTQNYCRLIEPGAHPSLKEMVLCRAMWRLHQYCGYGLRKRRKSKRCQWVGSVIWPASKVCG